MLAQLWGILSVYHVWYTARVPPKAATTEGAVSLSKAEATIEALVDMIERGQLRLLEIQRRKVHKV